MGHALSVQSPASGRASARSDFPVADGAPASTCGDRLGASTKQAAMIAAATMA